LWQVGDNHAQPNPSGLTAVASVTINPAEARYAKYSACKLVGT